MFSLIYSLLIMCFFLTFVFLTINIVNDWKTKSSLDIDSNNLESSFYLINQFDDYSHNIGLNNIYNISIYDNYLIISTNGFENRINISFIGNSLIDITNLFLIKNSSGCFIQ